MGTFPAESHTSARMMKEATGVARTTASAGRITSPSNGAQWHSTARATPSTTPRTYAAPVRTSDMPTQPQKVAFMPPARYATTCPGEASSRSCPTAR